MNTIYILYLDVVYFLVNWMWHLYAKLYVFIYFTITFELLLKKTKRHGFIINSELIIIFK